MHLKDSSNLTKIFLAIIALTITSYSTALTLEPSITTCYGVGKDDNMSFKSYCLLEGGGGTGIYSEMYTLKGRKYSFTYIDDKVTMNDLPFQTYGRNALFKRVPISKTGKNYTYICFKSSQADFCVKY